MRIEVPDGRYVVAVSGGVDSVVLLALLADYAAKPGRNITLTVAHFDHGIRPDSAEDRHLVGRLAATYRLPFVFDCGMLGADTSEAVARKARYSFLRAVQQRAGADAIITAHHRDDVLETIIINWLRGTKSRGLSSLRSNGDMLRPLLDVTKEQIHMYATEHKLTWREDSTNEDERYLRNYVRRQLLPHLDDTARSQLLAYSEKAAELNDAIHAITEEYILAATSPNSIDRKRYRQLPPEVSREILAEWLRRNTETTLTSKLLERLDTALRTGRNSSLVDITNGMSFKLGRDDAQLLQPR